MGTVGNGWGWERLETVGNVWERLGTFENGWERLGTVGIGNVWKRLGMFGVGNAWFGRERLGTVDLVWNLGRLITVPPRGDGRNDWNVRQQLNSHGWKPGTVGERLSMIAILISGSLYF